MPEGKSGANVVVPVYDVYYSFIKNHLIDIDELAEKDATDTEHKVSDAFNAHQEKAVSYVQKNILSPKAPTYEGLSEEGQEYATYIIRLLRDEIRYSGRAVEERG